MTTTTHDAETLVTKLKEFHSSLTPAEQSLLTYIVSTATTTGTTDEVTGYTATDTTWTGLTSWLTTTTTSSPTSTSSTTTTTTSSATTS